MRRVLIIVLIVVPTLTGSVSGEEIMLKKSFFTGWKYSLDGISYEKVGLTGSSLRFAMEGNEAAQKEMDTYKSQKIGALLLGAPGGFLIGWPIGAAIGGGEWKDSYNVMLGVGVSLGIVSTVLDMSANGHMQKAVRIYNGDEQAAEFSVGLAKPLAVTRPQVSVRVAWRF